ncbi:hypothetical protein AG1IA_08005 [Rhizoctonia solani AG-1 IA]|uniref:Uncharacterized protein n=1 Tax=Thanatephorus cucumeris (strain AG1-IA) TaxID=983506 RepID=L8WMC7_THACA|nr:hypothetical protein AG1IA_08005 [Rhizoctonia solani AG-1 IA]
MPDQAKYLRLDSRLRLSDSGPYVQNIGHGRPRVVVVGRKLKLMEANRQTHLSEKMQMGPRVDRTLGFFDRQSYLGNSLLVENCSGS